MEQIISHFISDYAYQPYLVYGAICTFMLLSAFGLPLPEEAVLVSSGLVGYMSLHPTKFPPPYEGAQTVNVYVLAVVAFAAVMFSDYVIYWLGRNVGPKLFKSKWFSRFISETRLEKIRGWMDSYGDWAIVIFRFTPGVRFPGHLSVGAMGISPWRFLLIDTIAAGLSVPTQVLLVSFYGHVILENIARFKLVILGALLLGFAVLLTRKYFRKRETS